MVSHAFHTVVYVPLYNALVAIFSLGSWVDLGIAVIVLTVLVKTALFPLSLKAARTQMILKEIETPTKEIREKYKNNKEEQGRKLLELYRENNINPLSSIFLLFIQLPVILGLYFVFLKGGFPAVQTEILYNFIKAPSEISAHFLGFLDMTSKNVFLAIFAGISQFFQAKYALPSIAPRAENASFQEDFVRSLQMQTKFVLPIVIAFVAYVASAAVALYWITSNIFAIGQELQVRKRIEAEKALKNK